MTHRAPLPRGRRSGIAAVVALVIVAAAVLAAITAVQIFTGRAHTAVGDVAVYGRNLRQVRWRDDSILITGIVLAAVGALVLLAGLLPARTTLLRLADPDPDTLSGITRDGLEADMTATAKAVDGVVKADVKVGRRRIRIRAESPYTDRTGLAEAIRLAAQQRVDALQPVQRLTVRAKLRRKVSRKEA